MIVLENDGLRVQIKTLGAELKEIFDKSKQKQILYQGNTPFWNRSAPVLFPIVGKLKNNQYTVGANMFEMGQHGFARDREFNLCEQGENYVRFSLSWDEVSKELYPFRFELFIEYLLEEQGIRVKYAVENKDERPILFSIGAHPAFLCPISAEEVFSDYQIRFPKDLHLKRHLLDQSSGLYSGETEEMDIPEGILELNEELFEKDALVFKKLNSEQVFLERKDGSNSLRFDFPEFPYFAIWKKPGAPFICLEPWFGLADHQSHEGKLEEKEGILHLEAGKSFSCEHQIHLVN
ncbi:MAG: aldose 1-epimerase family protein [Bacteroidetes bacterium]|nr:MAG: aldose 1-epimerase family protein [Bacteroidota bacterium]